MSAPMPEHLREHLRKECADKHGEPKLFVYLNGHKCEQCAEIIRWAAEGHELEALR
jgi:hypothetical protein